MTSPRPGAAWAAFTEAGAPPPTDKQVEYCWGLIEQFQEDQGGCGLTDGFIEQARAVKTIPEMSTLIERLVDHRDTDHEPDGGPLWFDADQRMEEDLPFYLLWLLLDDEEFARDYGPLVDKEDYPRGPLGALAALATEQAIAFRLPTTPEVLVLKLHQGWDLRRFGTDGDEVIATYDRLLEAYTPDEEIIPRLKELVVDWLRRRKAQRAVDAASASLTKGDIEGAEDSLNVLRNIEALIEPVYTLDGDLSEILGPLSDDAVPTGFGKIDGMWQGGVRPQEFAVLLALTSVGKSMTLAFMAATAWKRDKRVLYYTLELSQKESLRRILSGVVQEPVNNLSLSKAKETLQSIRLQRGLERAHIEVRGGSTASVASIAADLTALSRDGEKPDVVMLDSADDLAPEGKYRSLYESQGEIYTHLRKLALSANVAIWTTTQTNREAIGKARVSLRHAGDSFRKMQRGHFVLGIAPAKEEDDIPRLDVRVIKDSQHGSAGNYMDATPLFGRGEGGFAAFQFPGEDRFSR